MTYFKGIKEKNYKKRLERVFTKLTGGSKLGSNLNGLAFLGTPALYSKFLLVMSSPLWSQLVHINIESFYSTKTKK